MKFKFRNDSAMSLVEVLIVISVIGVISAIAIPMVSNVFESSNGAKDRQNAKNLESLSRSLAALGVAHVIPDSMGGVEATARLLSKGVIVPEGPMAGEVFILSGMGDEDITALTKYLKIEYDLRELRLVYFEPEQSSQIIESDCKGLCLRNPARIERRELCLASC